MLTVWVSDLETSNFTQYQGNQAFERRCTHNECADWRWDCGKGRFPDRN